MGLPSVRVLPRGMARWRRQKSDAGLGASEQFDSGRHDGVEAFAGLFEFGAVGFEVAQQVEPEFVEREVGERDGVVEVFEVENLVLEPLELAIAEEQVFLDEVFELAGIEQVVGLRGGKVHQRHAGFDALLDVEVVVEVGDGPEVDELDRVVARADAVDAAEALDDADRVPVDVVVDEQVAVLKVLAFADAVGGDEQVDFLVVGWETRGLVGAAFGDAARSW